MTHRDDGEAGIVGDVEDVGTPILRVAVEVVDKTGLGTAYVARKGTTTEVEVETYDALALEGERGTEVDGDEGLAGSGIGRRGHDDARMLGGAWDAHVLNVGTDDTEGLVDEVGALVAHEDGGTHLGLLATRLATRARIGQRELTDEWCGERLEVLTATDLGVELLEEVDDGHRDGQTEEEGDEEDLGTVRRRRTHRAHRRRDETRVVGGEGL